MATIPDSATKGNPDDKLILVGPKGYGGVTGSGSPFVMKVETFCRLAGIPYEVELCSDPRQSPKGTVPFIKHGSVTMADTEFIVEYLTNTFDIKLKPSDTPLKRGTAVAVKRLCEHHLDYGIMYYLMMSPQGWKLVFDNFFAKMPIPLRWIASNKVRTKSQDTLHRQGLVVIRSQMSGNCSMRACKLCLTFWGKTSTSQGMTLALMMLPCLLFWKTIPRREARTFPLWY